MKSNKPNLRKAFWRFGCSGALLFAFNAEFDQTKKNEERATGPLCGGFMQMGRQCGMLWGAALGAGAESFRRNKNKNHATKAAITATMHIMKSYSDRTKTHNCREVTGCNPSTVSGLIKYLFSVSQYFV